MSSFYSRMNSICYSDCIVHTKNLFFNIFISKEHFLNISNFYCRVNFICYSDCIGVIITLWFDIILHKIFVDTGDCIFFSWSYWCIPGYCSEDLILLFKSSGWQLEAANSAADAPDTDNPPSCKSVACNTWLLLATSCIELSLACSTKGVSKAKWISFKTLVGGCCIIKWYSWPFGFWISQVIHIFPCAEQMRWHAL